MSVHNITKASSSCSANWRPIGGLSTGNKKTEHAVLKNGKKELFASVYKIKIGIINYSN